MVKYFNEPETKTKQGTPGDTGVVSSATPAASASTVGTAATQSQPTENGGNPATTQTQQTAAADQTAPQTTRRPLSNEYIQMKAQFDYDKAHPMKFESNLPKPDERTPVGDVYEPEEVVDFTNPKFAQKPAEFTPNIPGAEEGERQMRYIGPYDEGTYNYLGLQADMGNIPEAAIYQDAFDQVYGNKPGFVATDDRDGGFYEWARNVVDPEELRKAQKENKTRMGIIALADALRHFGNIYHTTKGAPAQTLTNATEKEYARQQQEEQLAIERLQKQYETEIRRLEKEAALAERRHEFEQRQELQRQIAEMRQDYQNDMLKFNREREENLQEDREARREENARYHDLQNSLGWGRINYGGGSRGGGGGRRSGGGGGRRGGGRSARGGSKGGLTIDVPDEIKTNDGRTITFVGNGEKDAYINELYDMLSDPHHQLVEHVNGNTGTQTKLKNIYEAAKKYPEVRAYLDDAGLTLHGEEGSFGRDGDRGAHSPKPAPAQDTTSKGGKKNGKVKVGATEAQQRGTFKRTAISQAKSMYENARSRLGGGRSSASSKPAAKPQAQSTPKPQAPKPTPKPQGQPKLKPGPSVERKRYSTKVFEGSRGNTLDVPSEVYNRKTGKWQMQPQERWVSAIYDATVRKGWVEGGAKTISQMVDKICDACDDQRVVDALNNMGIYFDDPNYEEQGDNYFNFERGGGVNWNE